MTFATLFLITLAAPPAASPDLCPLVATLNGVVAAETPYTPPPCPKIGFSILPEGGTMRSQGGAYFPDTGAIELAPDLDLTTAFGQSYLLHELVHAAQFADGADARARCPAQLEAEAYTVQAGFLRTHGLPREALMISMLASYLGGCGQDY